MAQRVQQNHLIPTVLDAKVFVEQLLITIIYAVAYMVNENEPPFGVLVPSMSDLHSLFVYANT